MGEVETFLKRHERTRFRHSEELIACIKSGECALQMSPGLTAAPVPTDRLLQIYQRRAEHLKQFDSPHAQHSCEDVLALCEELKRVPDESVQFWSFSKPPHFEYSVFESSKSHEILGCILGVDKRQISERDWEVLWKEDKR